MAAQPPYQSRGPYLPPSPDLEHLRLLALGFRICGVLVAISACFGLVYFFGGLAVVMNDGKVVPNEPVSRSIAAIFMGVGGFAVLVGWSLGVSAWVAARRMDERRGYVFILVIAGLMCLFQPLGLALGILTFIVMTRPSVRAMFPRNA